MNWFNVRPGTGSIVVDDGPEIVPIDPDEVGEVPEGRPCRFIVRLRGVSYQGDDVGSDWRYSVTINSTAWVSPRHHFAWRSFDPIGVEVYNDVRPATCERAALLVFTVGAREYDYGIFDDVGVFGDIIPVPCPEGGFGRQLTMAVPVPEYPPRFWRWICRRRRRLALMIFYFSIEARCEG
jgi:hypothetical protein